jgi:type II secretion system (T2SS) protein E
MAKLMLGELLVGAGLVSEEQVLAALRAQRGSGMPLGIYLVRSGILTETELISVLSQQLEVAIIDLDAVSLHDDAVKKIPPEYARANLVVAFRMEARTVVIATSDPTREEVLDHVRVNTHCDARFMLASPAAIDRAIERAYGSRMPMPTTMAPAVPRSTARTPVSLEQRIARLETAVTSIIDLLVSHELAKQEDFPTLK